MASEPSGYDADVIIVGGGPVGTMLSVLLGQQGHTVVIVDKWPSPYELPRAVTFDHEIARILATLGIDSDHDASIDYHNALYYWKNAERKTLLEVDWASIAASGWRTRYWFHQPSLEARLREIAAATRGVSTHRAWQAVGLDQDIDGVTVTGTVKDASGEARTETVRGRYVVGADGANSFVRQALGIEFEDHGFNFDWLILDVLPKVEMQFDPVHWQLCDPKRPTTIVPSGPGRRRWEFMVLPGETPEQLAAVDSAWALLEPWGVTPGTAELDRSAVYRFQARWAEVWRSGRGFIAGDAAHQMPPFAGEGMCAGLRDAVALSWRLDLVLRGIAADVLLDSYGLERTVHARHYIDFSMQLGQIICISDQAAAAARDARMIAELEASDGTPVDTDLAHLGRGVWIEGEQHTGELSMQGIVEHGGEVGRFDDVVGRGWIVIGYGESPRAALSDSQIASLELVGGRFVTLGAPGSDADVIDIEGTYRSWFAKIGSTFAIFRPDFYIAATSRDAATLRRDVDTVLSRLHLVGVPADFAILESAK